MKFLKNLDRNLSCFFLVCLTVIAFIQVLLRFVFNMPLSWTEETVRYCLIALIYISTVYTIRIKGSIRVEVIDMLIKGKAQAVLHIITDIFSAGIMFTVSYLAITMVENAKFVNQKSAALLVPMYIPYTVEVICFAFMGLAYLYLIVDEVKSLKGGESK